MMEWKYKSRIFSDLLYKETIICLNIVLQTPITEEDFVDFLIRHNIETVEELNDFSEMYLLMISEANEPCATYYTIEETVH
tara:strand:- start:218 stop:460 length:243 start_codon:yes stop_codon:yes gene_type:complete